jgi:hypothetical protein
VSVDKATWWQWRSVHIALVLISVIPLLYPALPPLNDLPSHLGRYHVALTYETSPWIQHYFGFEWKLIGNLGVDLLIVPVAKLAGLELGLKLIVIGIAALTATGILWVSSEAHGKVQPTALFALPLVYNYSFQRGYLNYCLAMALSLSGLALWIRLGRQKQTTARTILFIPISGVILISHNIGWGLFGVMIFSAELAQRRLSGSGWPASFWRSSVCCAPLALPLLALILTMHGTPVISDGWFNWQHKFEDWLSILRNRWQWFDGLSFGVVLLLVHGGWRNASLRYERLLGLPALAMVISYLVLPFEAMGGAFLDSRVIPYAMMMTILAICPVWPTQREARLLALLGIGFFGIRTVGTSWSNMLYSQEQTRALEALSVLPKGASVLSLVRRECRQPWPMVAADHAPALLIVRRDGFTNDQFVSAQQLLTVRAPYVGPYESDASHYVFEPRSCSVANTGTDLDRAIATFDRRGFGYVWTIGYPVNRVRTPDLVPIWHNTTGAVYRVQGTARP